jgi:hypothetical protein
MHERVVRAISVLLANNYGRINLILDFRFNISHRRKDDDRLLPYVRMLGLPLPARR